jgi:hypothetical protein
MAKISVRRLFVRDPYNKNSTATVATFSKEFDQFTNNANPAYDPSKAPGSVRVMDARSTSAERPGKASRGHQKVVTLGRTYFFGGKTLRRR